jgi:hypothetical protein
MCTVVQCSATLADDANLFVVVDPDGKIPDCHPGTNRSAGSLLVCPPPIS